MGYYSLVNSSRSTGSVRVGGTYQPGLRTLTLVVDGIVEDQYHRTCGARMRRGAITRVEGFRGRKWCRGGVEVQLLREKFGEGWMGTCRY